MLRTVYSDQNWSEFTEEYEKLHSGEYDLLSHREICDKIAQVGLFLFLLSLTT